MNATIEMLKVTDMTWRHGVATLHYDNGSTAVLGHVRDLWPLFEAGLLSPEVASRMARRRAKAKPDKRRRSEAAELEGKTILALTPDFDHSGPPPADERCACGSRLPVDDEAQQSLQRLGGVWQCVACWLVACPCGNKALIKGLCAFHAYGYCATPGHTHRAPVLARHLVDLDGAKVSACPTCYARITKDPCATDGCERPVHGAGLCAACYRGLCPVDGCSNQAQSRDGTCFSHSPRCSEPGCNNGVGTSQSGRCYAHDNGVCKVDGCSAYAKAREHGLCGFHRDNGPDAVQREDGPGWHYRLLITDFDGVPVGVGWGGTASTAFKDRMSDHKTNLAAAGLMVSAISRRWTEDAKFAKEQVDNWFKDRGPTICDAVGEDVIGFKEESAAGVDFSFFVDEFDALLDDWRHFAD